MNYFEKKAQELRASIELLQADAERMTKLVEKLEAAQDLAEPPAGSVVRFSRPLAGSKQKYTFVVARIGVKEKSWFVTGTDNGIRLLGLNNKGNSWHDVLVAAGSNKIRMVDCWSNLDGSNLGKDGTSYRYFESSLSQWRYDVTLNEVHFRSKNYGAFGEWFEGFDTTLKDLVESAENPTNGVFEVVSLTEQKEK